MGHLPLHLSPPPAHSAPADVPAALERAAKLHQAAREALREGDFDRCFALASRAWELKQHEQVSGIRADCGVRVGEYLVALKMARITMAEFEPASKIYQRMERVMSEAKGRLGELRFAITPAQVAATVEVDGEPVELVGGAVFVAPGSHRYRVTAEGYAPQEATVELAPGAATSATVELRRAGLEQGGGLPPPEPVDDGGGPAWAYVTGVGAGLTVAAVVAGVVLLRQASAADDRAAQLRTELGGDDCGGPRMATCQGVADELSEGDNLANASTGLFIGAGALGLTTLITAIAVGAGDASAPAQEAAAKATWHLHPILSPHQLGLHGTWTW